MIITACGTCGKVFKLSDDKAGKRGKCQCGAVLHIPQPQDAVQSASTASTAPVAADLLPPVQALSAATLTPPAASSDVPARNSDRISVHDLLNRIRPYAKDRKVRIAAVAASVVLVVGITYYKITDAHADARAKAVLQIEEDYQRTLKSAERIGRQADADLAEAGRLRSQARDLREQPAEGAAPTHRMTRVEAIENDSYIMFLIDRHPQLKSALLSDGLSLDSQVPLLVSQGKLDMTDARYISRFQAAIRNLPR